MPVLWKGMKKVKRRYFAIDYFKHLVMQDILNFKVAERESQGLPVVTPGLLPGAKNSGIIKNT